LERCSVYERCKESKGWLINKVQEVKEKKERALSGVYEVKKEG